MRGTFEAVASDNEASAPPGVFRKKGPKRAVASLVGVGYPPPRAEPVPPNTRYCKHPPLSRQVINR